MKRTALLTGLAVVGAGGLALAMMLPPTGGMSQGTTEFDFVAPPPLGDVVAPIDTAEQVRAEKQELPELVQLQAAMTPAEQKAEDDYLSLKPGPDVDVSGIQRVPGAAENQPYRTCEKTPEMKANIRSPGDTGNRAYRDIDSYLSVTNVIATKDCTCAAKIIPHDAIAMFEDRLRAELGVTILEPKHTSNLYDEYELQKKIVVAMCGKY